MAAHFFCLASCVLRSGSDYGTIETASGLCLNSCRLLLWSVEVQNHWICPQGTEVVSVTCRHMKSGLKVSLYLSIFWGEKKCKAGTQLHKCHYSHSSSCHFRPAQLCHKSRVPSTSLFWMALGFRQLKFNFQAFVLSFWLKSIWDPQQISWFLCKTQIMTLSM